MTKQKAIERLQTLKHTTVRFKDGTVDEKDTRAFRGAIRIAIECIGKQIPKKPKQETINRGIDVFGEYDIEMNYICANCGTVVGDYEDNEMYFKFCPDCGQAQAIDMHVVETLIKNEPTISQWIPVSERLPDDGELVLLTFEGSEKVDMETAIYDVKYGFSTSDMFGLGYGIIAWMPLPEPYKVGDNE